jgi:hypothetical protein
MRFDEIKKGEKDANGYTRCWPGKHAEGTKKGKNGGQVRACVPNESVDEGYDPGQSSKLIAAATKVAMAIFSHAYNWDPKFRNLVELEYGYTNNKLAAHTSPVDVIKNTLNWLKAKGSGLSYDPKNPVEFSLTIPEQSQPYTFNIIDVLNDQDITEARASSASFRQGNSRRAATNAMSPEERKAHEDKRAEQQRKRDDARMERERQKKKGVSENTSRAVDSKGRTQQQWIQLVKSKFPNAKIIQAKMIDGPCQATLPDGKTLQWNPESGPLTEFLNTQAVAQDPGLEREKDVDVIFFGRPGKDWRAEDGWNALWEVLPQEYPPGSERAQYKVLEVNRNGGAVVTTKPLSIAKKLVATFQGYGIKSRINGINESVAEEYNAEYDDEAGMADNNLSTLRRAVEGLDDLIDAGDNLPEWCQEKIAVAKSMLVAVWDYMESEEQGVEEGNSGELERLQADVWDFYKDVHNMRPRQWSQEQWNDENFLRLQMKQLSDIVNNMSPEEKSEQGWV